MRLFALVGFLVSVSALASSNVVLEVVTTSGEKVQVTKSALIDALNSEPSEWGAESSWVNSDGSTTFIYPKFKYAGQFRFLYSEDIMNGPAETEKGYCWNMNRMSYVSAEMRKFADAAVRLSSNGKFVKFYPQQFSGIVTQLTCRK